MGCKHYTVQNNVIVIKGILERKGSKKQITNEGHTLRQRKDKKLKEFKQKRIKKNKKGA